MDRWRAASLRAQLTEHFETDQVKSRDVLDFGCGSGELSQLLVEPFGARSVIGLDLKRELLARADEKRCAADSDVQERLCFVLTEDEQRINLPDKSVDLICCFDVVEHILKLARTAAEWTRVLRPGGAVWIWWSPWRGPYGHHVESLLPLPWIHLICSARTIFSACAEMYDHDDFVPRIWDVDIQTGCKRPNRWRTKTHFEPFLNKLTSAQFERIILRNGLSITHRAVHGFGGSTASRATRPLLRLPILGECFVSFYTYRLAKPS